MMPIVIVIIIIIHILPHIKQAGQAYDMATNTGGQLTGAR